MGRFVIAAYKSKPGREDALLAVVRKHRHVLRAENLVSDKPAHLMRSAVFDLTGRVALVTGGDGGIGRGIAPYNIQVNAIAPGWIETDMTAPVRMSPWNDEILMRTPAGRWGRPEDVAGTAVYLASRASITGATIFVDGGYAIR